MSRITTSALMAIALVLSSMSAVADDISGQQLQRERALLLDYQRGLATVADNISSQQLRRERALLLDYQRGLREPVTADLKATASCFIPQPFPVAPPPGAQSVSFTSNSLGDVVEGIWWRQSCGTDGSTVMFLRVTPRAGIPFVCGSAFTLVQNGTQHDVKLTQIYNGSSFCGDLHAATTLMMTNWSFDPPFDPVAASDLYFDDYPNNIHVFLPQFSVGPAPITPAVGLWWNPAESGSGYNIDVKHGVLVLTVYSYKSNGDSEWYIATGTLTNAGRSFVGSLDKTRNGQCISCPYKAPTPGGSDGQVTIEFSSATNGTMTLPGGRAIPIVPQAF
jgi:hypothetical protein